MRISIASSLVSSEHGVVFGGDPAEDYSTLHAWSTEHPGEFWAMVWDELGVIGDRERLHEPDRGCVITGSFRTPPGMAENLYAGRLTIS